MRGVIPGCTEDNIVIQLSMNEGFKRFFKSRRVGVMSLQVKDQSLIQLKYRKYFEVPIMNKCLKQMQSLVYPMASDIQQT